MKVVPLEYGSAFKQGIDLFNQGEYFDAHEAWEGLWLRVHNSKEMQFLQGLIMAAAAFLHAQKKECTGAARLLAKSIHLLRDGVGVHPDLKLSDFIEALERLGSQANWCPTGIAQTLPKIGR